MADSSLIISHAKLEQEDSVVLTTAIKLLSLEGIPFDLTQDNVDKAHLVIADDETLSGRNILRQSRAGQVKIILSHKHRTGKNVISVAKPLELTSIKSLLSRLFSMMHVQLKKRNAMLTNVNKSKQANIEILAGTLFNILLDTKSEKKVIKLSCRGKPDVYIDGINHSLATNATPQQLREIAQSKPGEITIQQLQAENFAVHSNHLSIMSLYNFLWQCGVLCSKGRLLEGHSPERKVKLRAWPNFTRHDFKAEYFKLAALLAKNSYNLNELESVSNIAKSEVINFYNAAFAVDLLDANTVSQGASPVQKNKHAEKQGLFAKIAQRLSLRSYK